ncbi:MAG: helix-turn-helix transcriptional regulator [Clostridia bacterium]|nr:helix-turn-helix transcriptional regulator [Clostridia bacterium]
MSISFKFANLILNARLDSGLTQSEVAQAVSVSTRWIQRIEAGEKLPGTLTMLRLILFFDLDIEELRKEIGLIEPISDNRRRLFAKHSGK